MNGSPVSSCSVLIVEDETLLRMMMTEMLEELGHRVAAEAARLEQALPLAQSADFDLAVLDVNIAGQLITPVAELIAARRRPIIFATGYGVSGLPEAFRDRSSEALHDRWAEDRHRIGRAALGTGRRGCGGAGAPCPDCSKTNPADPDDVPAIPGCFIPDLS
jgi:CheY-like chemotaxis protein